MTFLWRRRACTPRLTLAIVQPSSEIRKHAVQTARVLGTNVVRLPEVALPLGRLLGEDVAAVGVACLVLAGSGLPEALGRAPMRLDLGHCDVLGVVSSTGPGGVRDYGSSFHPAWPVCKPLISAGNQGRSKVLRTASPENRAGHYACRRAGLQSGSPPCCLPRSRGRAGVGPPERGCQKSEARLTARSPTLCRPPQAGGGERSASLPAAAIISSSGRSSSPSAGLPGAGAIR